jgi:hypothetical protein
MAPWQGQETGNMTMAMGFVLIGMLAGMLAAGGVLIAGAGIGMALLAYAGTGTAGVLLGAAMTVLPRPVLAGGMASRA